jgi:YD repeat-containing protein
MAGPTQFQCNPGSLWSQVSEISTTRVARQCETPYVCGFHRCPGCGATLVWVTSYQYLDPVNANRCTSEVYPDSSTVTLAYNVDGSLSQKTDPRGVALSYAYTNNRLLATESVTTVPSGVDGTIQSIAHTYDNLNRPQNITSYASPGGTGTVVNDIQYAYYNGTAKPVTSYQEHYGAVNTLSPFPKSLPV